MLLLYMTDQVEKEALRIEYCSTYKMWGDFVTNPTQGEKCRNFINYVLGEKMNHFELIYEIHCKKIYIHGNEIISVV